MAAAVKLRSNYSASDLRRLAAASKHANQSRRLLSLAAVLDGMDREQKPTARNEWKPPRPGRWTLAPEPMAPSNPSLTTTSIVTPPHIAAPTV